MAEHDLISKTALLEHLDMAMECENCPRNADKELYKCVHNSTSEHCTCSDIAQICIRITEFATFADVQPVKHGRWLSHHAIWIDQPKIEGWFVQAKCSECERWAHVMNPYTKSVGYKCCPNCGARMDLEDGDTNG